VKISVLKKLSVVIAALTIIGITSAHANSLIATAPVGGSTFTTPPTSVTLTTQVALLPDGSEIVVTDPAGLRVDDGTITINDVSATVGLKPLVASGIYRATYVLYSEGEAPLQGSFTFNFSAPSVITPTDPTPTPTETQKPASSSWGTNIFIFFILFVAFSIFIGLILYARKLFRDR
jgi:methionine-rich copper-binding protein CopC